jgi:hypothetical protein
MHNESGVIDTRPAMGTSHAWNAKDTGDAPSAMMCSAILFVTILIASLIMRRATSRERRQHPPAT